MTAPVIIYDTDLNKVAYLPNAFGVAYHMRANEVGRAWFSVPVDDPHISEIQELRYAEIYDGDRRIEMFRILTSWKASDMTQRFECEHVLGTLMDDEFETIFYVGAVAGTEDAIDDILDEQGTARWTQGTCAFSEDYLYEWQRGTSLLRAVLDIPKRFQAGYFWTYDTTSYPWTLNLIEPPTSVTAYVDYGRNMKSISRKKDLSGLVTKLYPHGAKAGTDQIGISTVEPSGNDYITNNTGTYGTIVHHWTDQRYATEAELYSAAVDYLATISEPAYTYTIEQADMFRLTGESIDSYSIGTLVQVDNPELDITTDVRVMEIKKSDVTGKPGEIVLTFANKGQEFDLSPKLDVNNLSGIVITDIPGGIPGQLPVPVSGEGLYITTDYLGYYSGTSWSTYMDITGKLWADYDGYYIHFDPAATPPLQIKADGTWYGNVSISKLTAGSLDVNMTLTAGGLIKSDNYAAGTSGWKINSDGSAEFQDVIVRGTLNASDLVTGNLNFSDLSRSFLTVSYGEIAANAVRTGELYIDGDVNFKPGASYNSVIGLDGWYKSDSKSTTLPYANMSEYILNINSGTNSGNGVSISAAATISLNTTNINLIADYVKIPGIPTSDPGVASALWSSGGSVQISSG